MLKRGSIEIFLLHRKCLSIFSKNPKSNPENSTCPETVTDDAKICDLLQGDLIRCIWSAHEQLLVKHAERPGSGIELLDMLNENTKASSKGNKTECHVTKKARGH